MDSDEVLARIPIRLSSSLKKKVQIHQYPLLNRPLQVPPSAAQSGRSIRARIKPHAQRLEIHVPADTRPEVWNIARGQDLGAARVEDDREKNQEKVDGKDGQDDQVLSHIRLKSEHVPQAGPQMVGILRDGASI